MWQKPAALLCNEASVHPEGHEWRVNGDPTEGALVVAGLKAGLDEHLLAESQPRVDVIPFESEHRFMATLNRDAQGQQRIYIKGAPEVLLHAGVSEAEIDLRDREASEEMDRAMAMAREAPWPDPALAFTDVQDIGTPTRGRADG